MDGSILDHSDSDSGESWILLEPSPTYGDDAPDFAGNQTTFEQETNETNIDEDTDGISVISDSEPEVLPSFDISYDKCILQEPLSETHPNEMSNPPIISLNSNQSSNDDIQESIRCDDDFLGVNTGKHKTYVHRRNKRLSTVLNIIMLGSVITAAGVAIGHMWGAKNECFMQTPPSINKILSNLYKLQEENAYLRTKLKELSLASSIHMQQKKINLEKIPFKQQRCKKVYEEPLNSKNIDKITKCVEVDDTNSEKILSSNKIPQFEKEFLNDIDKLKNIYLQNKSWLDEEVARRIKNEEQTVKKMVKSLKTPLTSITEEQKVVLDDNIKELSDKDHYLPKINKDAEQLIISELDSITTNIPIKTAPAEWKISYADSLKSDQPSHRIKKRNINTAKESQNDHEHVLKKKIKKEEDAAVYDTLSEEEIKKDDRYVHPKMKVDKRKRDRQKTHKKQKRRNKYEQWEMKGGYLKDYDEFSLTSSHENEFVLKKPDENHFAQDFEKKHYMNQFTQNYDDHSSNLKGDLSKTAVKTKQDTNWFDQRAALRTEARKRLEHEQFGETPNNAGWYFNRMKKREQCRVKSDNSTYKKLFKRNMNFKMKK